MAEPTPHTQEEEQRYALFSPGRRDRRNWGETSALLDDDLSEDPGTHKFQVEVIKSYDELVGRTRKAENPNKQSHPEGQESNSAVHSEDTLISARHVPPTHEELNDRYRRLVKIGEGSFGEVFIVYDTCLNTYFTMKRMRRLLHRGTHRSLIGLHNTTFRELQLLTTLRHPNVVEVLDYHILTDGSMLVLMPVVAHDFAMLVRHWGAMSPTTAGSARMPLCVIKCLFRQLLEGVAYMHRRKVVHRDLKPSNIMIDANGVLKIIDFGWARYMVNNRSVRMTGPPCIVPYRAPEVLIGGSSAAHYTFAIDVWSCGCILFEMLSAGTSFVTSRAEPAALAGIVDWLGSPSPKSAVYYGRDARLLEAPRSAPGKFTARCATMSIAPREADFLARMLHMEPSTRATAKDLLLDDWFTTAPAACTPPEVPLPAANTYRYLEHQRKRKRT